jgi:hypothetical protein
LATTADRLAIVDVFVEVTILPTARRFQPFDPESVRFVGKADGRPFVRGHEKVPAGGRI